MTRQEQIAELIEKYKKNSGKAVSKDISQAASILAEGLIQQDFSAENIVDYFCELHKNVVLIFIEINYPRLSDEDKMAFSKAIILNKKIIENKSGFGMGRCLKAVVSLIYLNDKTNFDIIMKWCVRIARGKDNYESAGKLLSKDCIDTVKEKLFLCDYDSWNEKELNWLNCWFEKALISIESNAIKDAYAKFLNNYLHIINVTAASNTKQNNNEINKENDVGDIVSHNNDSLSHVADSVDKNQHQPTIHKRRSLGDIMRMLNSETSELLQEKANALSEIEKLKRLIAEKSTEAVEMRNINSKLEAELDAIRLSAVALKSDLNFANKSLQALEEKNAELILRLKSSFEADTSIANQELSNFKRSLSKSLNNDYLDYMKLSKKEAVPQYYKALIDLIEGVFDTLRRKGLCFTEEQ